MGATIFTGEALARCIAPGYPESRYTCYEKYAEGLYVRVVFHKREKLLPLDYHIINKNANI